MKQRVQDNYILKSRKHGEITANMIALGINWEDRSEKRE